MINITHTYVHICVIYLIYFDFCLIIYFYFVCSSFLSYPFSYCLCQWQFWSRDDCESISVKFDHTSTQKERHSYVYFSVINTHMTTSGPRVQWVGGWARQQPCPHPLPHPRPNLISLITPAWTRPAICLIVSYFGTLRRLHAKLAYYSM